MTWSLCAFPSPRNEMCIFRRPDCCVHTSLCERGWVMAAKQLQGFCLNSSSENSAALLAFGKGDRGEEQQSVSHAQISVAVSSTLSSWLLPHWLPICLLYPQETKATANNLLSPRYPFIKKKKKENWTDSVLRNDKVPASASAAAAITACVAS